MKSSMRWIIGALVLLAIGIAAGLWIGRALHLSGSGEAVDSANHETDPEHEPEPVARVHTAQVITGDMVRTTDVYGSVIAQPGATVLTVMHAEVVIRRVVAEVGQHVRTGDPLCEVEPSPASKAALETARAEVDSTTKLLEAAQEKESMKLGTRQDVLQAQAAQREAQLKVAQLEASLPDSTGIIHSSVEGSVTAVHIETGAVIAAGAPLVETLARDAIVVQLGVPVEDARALRAGQGIAIEPIGARSAQHMSVTIRLINAAIDPASRLVNVLADPPQGVELMLGANVRGVLETKIANALIVPRSAVLPREDQFVVFTIDEGHAHEHIVTVGQQNHDVVEITSGDLKPGDDVITLGNYELTDGMAVEVESGT